MDVKEIVGNSEYSKGYHRKRRILRMLIIITGLASFMLIILTYYGHNAGNFTIRVNESNNRSIAISETLEGLDTNPQSRLSTKAISDASDLTYSNIKVTQATQTDGAYKDRLFNYMAYTFYCKNVGQRAGTLVYSMSCFEASKNMDAAARVMLIEETWNRDISSNIYRKLDPVIDLGYGGTEIYWDETNWLDSSIIFEKEIENFMVGEYRKFTLFIWLEGHDPDTTDQILGGKVKFDMLLTINPNDVGW